MVRSVRDYASTVWDRQGDIKTLDQSKSNAKQPDMCAMIISLVHLDASQLGRRTFAGRVSKTEDTLLD